MRSKTSRRSAQRARAAVVVALLSIAGCGGSPPDSGRAAPDPERDATLAALRAAPRLTPPGALAYRDCDMPQISSVAELGDAAKPAEQGRVAVRCRAGALALHLFQDDGGASKEFAATSGRPKGADTPPSAPQGTICSTDGTAITCMRLDGRLLFVATTSTTADDAAVGLSALSAWAKTAVERTPG